jgi:hypothetical protein
LGGGQCAANLTWSTSASARPSFFALTTEALMGSWGTAKSEPWPRWVTHQGNVHQLVCCLRSLELDRMVAVSPPLRLRRNRVNGLLAAATHHDQTKPVPMRSPKHLAKLSLFNASYLDLNSSRDNSSSSPREPFRRPSPACFSNPPFIQLRHIGNATTSARRPLPHPPPVAVSLVTRVNNRSLAGCWSCCPRWRLWRRWQCPPPYCPFSFTTRQP